MKGAAISILFVVSLAFAVSTFPDYPAKQSKECRVAVEKNDISVGLDPLERVENQRTYFGADLTKKGFVPVFLVIENGMNSDSVIFDRTKITYGPASSPLIEPKTGLKVGKATAFSTIPFFGGFAGARIIAKAANIQSNLINKELQSTTISPGASARGFLYIPIDSKSPTEKIALRVPLGKAGTDEDVQLELIF